MQRGDWLGRGFDLRSQTAGADGRQQAPKANAVAAMMGDVHGLDGQPTDSA
jgi:hypothetical protein